jgi:hypothetical protein
MRVEAYSGCTGDYENPDREEDPDEEAVSERVHFAGKI